MLKRYASFIGKKIKKFLQLSLDEVFVQTNFNKLLLVIMIDSAARCRDIPTANRKIKLASMRLQERT
jgi:hypothetical protein